MTVSELRVSEQGQMALPAEARHRWNLSAGGTVEVIDLGSSLVIVPGGGGGGIRVDLVDAIADAGG